MSPNLDSNHAVAAQYASHAIEFGPRLNPDDRLVVIEVRICQDVFFSLPVSAQLEVLYQLLVSRIRRHRMKVDIRQISGIGDDNLILRSWMQNECVPSLL